MTPSRSPFRAATPVLAMIAFGLVLHAPTTIRQARYDPTPDGAAAGLAADHERARRAALDRAAAPGPPRLSGVEIVERLEAREMRAAFDRVFRRLGDHRRLTALSIGPDGVVVATAMQPVRKRGAVVDQRLVEVSSADAAHVGSELLGDPHGIDRRTATAIPTFSAEDLRADAPVRVVRSAGGVGIDPTLLESMRLDVSAEGVVSWTSVWAGPTGGSLTRRSTERGETIIP